MPTAILLFWLIVALPSAAFAHNAADGMIEKAKRDCELTTRGKFSLRPDAITRIDLTGDGVDETLIDSGKFNCSAFASLYGGSAGFRLTIINGENSWNYVAQAWKIEEWLDKPILLMHLHGTSCGGAGSDPCVIAHVWNGKDFVSVLSKK